MKINNPLQQPSLFPAEDDEAPVLSKLERNIEKWPLFPLYRTSKSGEEGPVTELYVEIDEHRYWKVIHPRGLPGPIGNDMWVALCALYNEARTPPDRTVRTSLKELADLLEMTKGGTTWALLWDTLTRLEEVRIEQRNTFRMADGTHARTERIPLITKVAKEELLSHPVNIGRTFEIRFSEEVAHHLSENGKMYRLLDLRAYRRLQAPTARRLYRYLDQRRFRGSDAQEQFAVPLIELKERLPLAGSAPSEVKRTLNGAHEEMVKQGFLLEATYRKVKTGRSLDVWEVVYTMPPYIQPGSEKDAVRKSIPSTQRVRTENASKGEVSSNTEVGSEYLRDTVEAILRGLKDPHSAAFYAKVVKVLPVGMPREILNAVLKDTRESGDLEAARKLFTFTAKGRAQQMGIDL